MPRLHSISILIAAISVGAASLAGCSRGDTAVPVAKLTVTPSRTRVGIGGPLELTYRFEVGPKTSIAGDYRVFVHVLNAERQSLWNDDHDPPVPTSSWKPGQVIEYSRFNFVPVVAMPGEVTVEVGLYKDDRLPLETPEPTSRAGAGREYRVATLQFLPSAENVLLTYKTGWHPEEFPTADAARSWKWTMKSAVLSMKNPRADSVLFLQYDARPDLFPGHPQQVTVCLNDRVVETFAADSLDVRVRKIVLPMSQLGTADTTDVHLDIDHTFVPGLLPGGAGDTRELGIRVYHAFVDSR
ncbi:MAG: hypothetical protein ABI051_07145 [Vicinamibacterales bacterium]